MNVFYVYLINKNNRNQNTNAFQFFDVWRMRSFRNVLHTSFGDNDKEDMERTISTICFIHFAIYKHWMVSREIWHSQDFCEHIFVCCLVITITKQYWSFMAPWFLVLELNITTFAIIGRINVNFDLEYVTAIEARNQLKWIKKCIVQRTTIND